MSGHSKWSNIKRKKEITDAKKSKVFSKMSRLITVAARDGGADPDMNPTLRLAVDRAKQANMPSENIDKAIKKGSGALEGAKFERVVYEGYGPYGVAFMITTLTDNRNRTVSEIKNIFSKAGGSLGTPGSTSYIFDSLTFEPSFRIALESEEQLKKIENLEEALEDQDDVQEIYSNYEL
ncbi:YebC/PmpR family DNA-binding transcriptional regulator [Candidatus Nomurabacteria bacterium]|uniref:Probable transcriptional regulatory protein KDA10_03055 n=1 Tax=candidate division WWE3 bacterium TaxID=2053526 RepID=A0A955E178_UNCKA|nr:YebC/PmpR family DNA-binding transcriptional regulator [candidate division WWE3 bacterium]MCB9823697.1 YebC/PmpR family DNA-binding transcriptional regulator [Candidatus Nomurabacteria bacterium]MCB9827225.1 YebC/PmpR family DNA-binding transcriptional regulator [Candidatus Nomurabacteria bacterium]MCB9827492.1 YebC/PmpR family DNA-binding transcriptional regulator [Candidatus Nomurabacteria bacterium]HXK52521.1 YebC/PmpR family DNA-binding transcriptional regulator [bacterium]